MTMPTTKVTDPLGRQTLQTYESGGRLASVAGPNQAPTQYGYGGNGLLSSMSTTFLSINYQYDGRADTSHEQAGSNVDTSFRCRLRRPRFVIGPR